MKPRINPELADEFELEVSEVKSVIEVELKTKWLTVKFTKQSGEPKESSLSKAVLITLVLLFTSVTAFAVNGSKTGDYHVFDTLVEAIQDTLATAIKEEKNDKTEKINPARPN